MKEKIKDIVESLGGWKKTLSMISPSSSTWSIIVSLVALVFFYPQDQWEWRENSPKESTGKHKVVTPPPSQPSVSSSPEPQQTQTEPTSVPQTPVEPTVQGNNQPEPYPQGDSGGQPSGNPGDRPPGRPGNQQAPQGNQSPDQNNTPGNAPGNVPGDNPGGQQNQPQQGDTNQQGFQDNSSEQ